MVGEEEEEEEGRFVGGSHSNRTCFLVIDKRKQGSHDRDGAAPRLYCLLLRE